MNGQSGDQQTFDSQILQFYRDKEVGKRTPADEIHYSWVEESIKHNLMFNSVPETFQHLKCVEIYDLLRQRPHCTAAVALQASVAY